MNGRKPKPTALRVVTGNAGHRPMPRNEPKPAESRSSPPAFLSAEARTEWRRVIRALMVNGLMTALDRATLAAYCQAYGRWAQAEKALAKMAETDAKNYALLIKTTNGNAIQNPLVGTANKAAADMVRYAAEFGMSPAARARVSSGAGGFDDGKPKTGAAEFFG
jgi:P27 family predicted phage terminase small subunit